MRILHVSDCYLPRLGGIELQVHDLAARQRQAGHDVQILTATPPAADPDARVRSVPSLRGLPTPAGLSELADAVAVGDFDVVHGHSSLVSPLAWAAVRAAQRHRVPAVLTMHSMAPTGLLAGPLGRLLQPAADAALPTAVSTAAATALHRALDERPVRVLPNGIDPARWRPRHARLDTPVLTIVSVMRLAARKRPLPLLEMLVRIRQLVPADQPLRAVLVGAGPLQASVRRSIDALGLSGWVTLSGRLTRSEIQHLYEQSDLYLAPARLESFGIAALEARCAGLPVIAMSEGGVGDFIADGTDGFLVDSDDDMARAGAALLRSPARLRQMQRHLLATEPPVTWPAVLEACLEAYDAAAQERRPAPAVRDTHRRLPARR
ncbi:MAG: glycosyl transferase [Friedmanniella sp.]|nr:glycosyl transferase [Friedmanniella sp.]